MPFQETVFPDSETYPDGTLRQKPTLSDRSKVKLKEPVKPGGTNNSPVSKSGAEDSSRPK